MRNVSQHVLNLILIASVTITFAALAAQSTSLDDSLQKKIKKLYGPLAPKKITYVDLTGEAVTGNANASSRLGDSAAGVIVSEAKGSLFLDTRPCNAHIVVFSGHYRKSKIGETSCGEKHFDKFEVEQVR